MAIMIGLPLYTRFKTRETGNGAILVAVGGFLLGLAGIFLALVTRQTLLADTLTFGSPPNEVVVVGTNLIAGADVLIAGVDGYILLGLFAYLILFSVGFFVVTCC